MPLAPSCKYTLGLERNAESDSMVSGKNKENMPILRKKVPGYLSERLVSATGVHDFHQGHVLRRLTRMEHGR